MKKFSPTFLKVINQLDEVADSYKDEAGNRLPMCIIIRALRGFINPDIKEPIKCNSKEELIYEVTQMALEFIITTDVDYKWFVNTQSCLPRLDQKEINDLKETINLIRTVNKNKCN